MARNSETEGDAGLAAYYALRAAEYERIYQKPERQADLRALREYVRMALAGRHVLEIACGTGYWTERLAESAASVVATDLNEEVLRIARAKPIDPRKVRFASVDAYALPAFPERFTGGFAGFWWSHVPKSRLPAFLEQFHRSCRPESRFVLLDNRYVEGSSTPISRMDAEGNTYQVRRLDQGTTHEVLKNFPCREEILAILAGIGVQAEVSSLEYYWILDYVTPRAGQEIPKN